MGSHFPATLRKGHECLDSYLFFPHTWTWFHLREKKMPKTGSYFSIWEQLAFVSIQNLTSGTSFGHVAIYLLGFILVENLVCLRHCVTPGLQVWRVREGERCHPSMGPNDFRYAYLTTQLSALLALFQLHVAMLTVVKTAVLVTSPPSLELLVYPLELARKSSCLLVWCLRSLTTVFSLPFQGSLPPFPWTFCHSSHANGLCLLSQTSSFWAFLHLTFSLSGFLFLFTYPRWPRSHLWARPRVLKINLSVFETIANAMLHIWHSLRGLFIRANISWISV